MTEWIAELYRERSSLQQTMAAEVLQALELASSDCVLDVGCGDGMGPLVDLACAAQATWVEMALASNINKEKLRELLAHNVRACVVLQGEFYGPGVPDPKLPEAIKRTYRPGWGHLGGFKTKLIVHYIRNVRTAPSDPLKSQPQR